MKNPKWKCAYPNSHKVKFGGKFLTQFDLANFNNITNTKSWLDSLKVYK